jgi:hypothetical protein
MFNLPLRVVGVFPDRCVAETSCRTFTVKFSYEPDELIYEVGQEIGFACPKTSMVKLHRKFRQEGDYEPDKLKLEPVKPSKWLEMP